MLDGFRTCNQGHAGFEKFAQIINMKNGQFKSEFLPNCEIRISQVMRLFDEFLDILESLECVLQSIFEVQFEIPSGSVLKMALKWGRKTCQNRSKIH